MVRLTEPPQEEADLSEPAARIIASTIPEMRKARVGKRGFNKKNMDRYCATPYYLLRMQGKVATVEKEVS